MSVESLDHYNIRVQDLEKSRSFYANILGMEDGARPSSIEAPGAWMYVGGQPVVHISIATEDFPRRTGAVDHVAFRVGELSEIMARLDAANVAYDLRKISAIDLDQLFFQDPDGVNVELNCYRKAV